MHYILLVLALVLQLFASTTSGITFVCVDNPETEWRAQNSTCSNGRTNVTFLHAESPNWDSDSDTFFWVDVINQNVYSLNFNTWELRTRHTEIGEINVLSLIEDSQRLLLAVNSSLYIMDWNIPGERGLRIVALTDQGMPENVLNEGKCDANGRFWVGSKGPQSGANVVPDQAKLYSLEGPYYEPREQWNPISISNGLAWSSNNTLMYYADSATRTVDVFDFDLDAGRLSNRRSIIDLRDYDYPDNAIADGLTIDRDGFLWVAINFAGVVARVDPDAMRIVRTIELPVLDITSLAWGGPNLETLFVTTSRLNLTPEQIRQQPLAGSVFAFNDLGTEGAPEFKFRFPNANTY